MDLGLRRGVNRRAAGQAGLVLDDRANIVLDDSQYLSEPFEEPVIMNPKLTKVNGVILLTFGSTLALGISNSLILNHAVIEIDPEL